MSAGQQQTPLPATQPTQPQIVVAQQSTLDVWLNRLIPIVATLIIGWLVTSGKIDKDTADKVSHLLVSSKAPDSEATTTETVTVETKVEPADKPVNPDLKPRDLVMVPSADKPVEVKAVTPEDIQMWADLIQQLLDRLKPPSPSPTPPSPVPPTPVPPQPPGPTPQPPKPNPIDGTLKIIVSDKLGKPIAATTVEAGKWFRVSAEGSSGRIRWTVTESPTGRAEVGLSGNGLEYSGTMQVGDWIDFDLYDKGNDAGQRMRLACNHGPQPPPSPVVPVDPVVPVPDEPPLPKPPVPVTSFRVIFVRESGITLPASQASVPGAKAVREYLFAKTTRENNITGWREYDPQTDATNEQATLKALWEAVKPKITDVPCMVIEVNGKADILPYPANPAEALATLKQYGGP